MNGHSTGILTTFPGSKTRCITPDIRSPYCSRAPRPVDATGEAVEVPPEKERCRNCDENKIDKLLTPPQNT